MTSIDSWEALARLSPAVGYVNRREGKRQWSDFGFAANQSGQIVLAELPAETFEKLAQGKAGKGVHGWTPLPPSSKQFGLLGALQAQLTTEGVRVADYKADGKSTCYLQMTTDYLLGSFASGHLIRGFEDATPQYANDSGTIGKGMSLCWRWPLQEIETIKVDRAKRMFKWWDAQISISGANGQSHFRCESINDYEKSLPVKSTLASDLLPVADVLAKAVAQARGMAGTPAWKIDTDRSEETHYLTFEGASN